MTRVISPKAWHDLPGGAYYRIKLEKAIAPWCAKIVGDHLLKLGTLSKELDTTACAIPHQILLDTCSTNHTIDVIASLKQLPFIEESIDACILIHAFAYTLLHPHIILNEINRVLSKDGWLIMSNFSLFSVVGLGELLPYLNQYIAGQFFIKAKLGQWLKKLNYEILLNTRLAALPQHPKWRRHLPAQFPLFSPLHLLIARKRRAPITFQADKTYLSQPWQHCGNCPL